MRYVEAPDIFGVRGRQRNHGAQPLAHQLPRLPVGSPSMASPRQSALTLSADDAMLTSMHGASVFD